MKNTFLFLFIGTFFLCEAQKNKTATLDPARVADIKTKAEQMHPKPVKAPVDKSAKTSTGGNVKSQKTEAEEAIAEESKPVTNAKPYSFLGSFTMNFDDKNIQGKTYSGKIQYAFDGFQAAMIPSFTLRDVKSLRALMDAKNNEVTTLTIDSKGKKTGLLMKRAKPVIAVADTKKTKASVVKKTGETKTIQGFKCEKILVTYPDSSKIAKIESWVTTELNLNMNDLINLANAGFRGKSPFSETNVSDVKSTALETTVTNRDGSEMKVTLTDIKKVKPAASLFSTDGFAITDVRALPLFGGK